MMQQNFDNIEYNSLSQIRKRKEELQFAIQEDSKLIRQQWDELFYKPTTLSSDLPFKRFSKYLNTGIGIADGFLLGWKLYRKLFK